MVSYVDRKHHFRSPLITLDGRCALIGEQEDFIASAKDINDSDIDFVDINGSVYITCEFSSSPEFPKLDWWSSYKIMTAVRCMIVL